MADRGNRERGLKAAINNPRVSEQAKKRDREILETEFGEHFEEGSGYRKTTAESASPEPMSSGFEGSDEDIEYLETPPRAKQTAGLRSVTNPVSKSSKMSSSEMMDSSSSSKSSMMRSSSAGARSSRPEEMEGKDVGNVIRGLKAAITNPNVSEKAKDKDRKKLRELGESVD
ncbi:hypothetical protein QBC34DRAFT_77393 [Podospora aff. communis PSN243]|uniref:Conidiation-specific protein 6 n=1 Tax=Podospora aff. communis PSN243 TaxID=3040156 RepID=A0AAV9GPT0_9PEZI|nr:hypothetical protein QBC34DRAFT_77393 [Podospora aff. communis PSN243]